LHFGLAKNRAFMVHGNMFINILVIQMILKLELSPDMRNFLHILIKITVLGNTGVFICREMKVFVRHLHPG